MPTEVSKKKSEEMNHISMINDSMDSAGIEFKKSLDSSKSSSESGSSSSDSSDSESSEAQEATAADIGSEEETTLKTAEEEEEEDDIVNGADVIFSESSSSSESSDSEEGEDFDEEEYSPDAEFIVDDETVEYMSDTDGEGKQEENGDPTEETQNGDPVPKKRARTPKMRKDVRQFFHSRSKEDSSDDEDVVSVEYNINKNLVIHDYIIKIYGSYFAYCASCALVPGWPQVLEEMITKAKKTNGIQPGSEIYSMKEQAIASSIIQGIVTKAMISIIGYIEQYKTKDDACLTLHSILFTEEGENNLQYVSFEKNSSTSSTCGITRSIIKRGQAWIVTYRYVVNRRNKSQTEEIIDLKWVQFLTYWQFLTRQADILKAMTKQYFEGTPLSPFPQEMFNKFRSKENIEKYARMFMTSLAFFYKFLDGTVQGAEFANVIEDKWFSVCDTSKPAD
jgi:hypothetical protein